MKSTILGLLLVSANLSLAHAACPTIDLPSSFVARETVLSTGSLLGATDMTLKAEGRTIGHVRERLVGLTTNFVLLNAKKEKVASARARLFSWGTTIDVADCDGKRIGTVKELVWKSLTVFRSQYEISDGAGRLVAQSKKKEFLTTVFEIRDSAGELAIKMRRPALNLLSDKWDMTVGESRSLDPRLVLMLPAFKTAADKRAEAEMDDSNE